MCMQVIIKLKFQLRAVFRTPDLYMQLLTGHLYLHVSQSTKTHHTQTKLIFIPLFFTPWLLGKWCHCQMGNLGIIFDSRSPTVLHLIFHRNPLVLLSKDLLLYPSPPPLPLKVIILIAVCLVLTLCQAPCLDH